MLTPGRVIRSAESRHRYRVGKFLDEGGFGKAFRARELDKHGRPIGPTWVIKVTKHQASWHREAYFGQLFAHDDGVIRVRETFPVQIGRTRTLVVPHFWVCPSAPTRRPPCKCLDSGAPSLAPLLP